MSSSAAETCAYAQCHHQAEIIQHMLQKTLYQVGPQHTGLGPPFFQGFTPRGTLSGGVGGGTAGLAAGAAAATAAPCPTLVVTAAGLLMSGSTGHTRMTSHRGDPSRSTPRARWLHAACAAGGSVAHSCSRSARLSSVTSSCTMEHCSQLVRARCRLRQPHWRFQAHWICVSQHT